MSHSGEHHQQIPGIHLATTSATPPSISARTAVPILIASSIADSSPRVTLGPTAVVSQSHLTDRHESGAAAPGLDPISSSIALLFRGHEAMDDHQRSGTWAAVCVGCRHAFSHGVMDGRLGGAQTPPPQVPRDLQGHGRQKRKTYKKSHSHRVRNRSCYGRASQRSYR
jgi:hypothetical protein